MSIRVCVLARWEAYNYTESLLAESKARAQGRRCPAQRPDCRHHHHIKIADARAMVTGSCVYARPRFYATVNGSHVHFPRSTEPIWYELGPVAEWVGPGERCITALVQPFAKFSDLSARRGFDRQGRTVKSGGKTGVGETGEEAKVRGIPNEPRRKIDVAPISANSATDWIGAMLSESPRRLPSTRSKMRTGNNGGGSSNGQQWWG